MLYCGFSAKNGPKRGFMFSHTYMREQNFDYFLVTFSHHSLLCLSPVEEKKSWCWSFYLPPTLSVTWFLCPVIIANGFVGSIWQSVQVGTIPIIDRVQYGSPFKLDGGLSVLHNRSPMVVHEHRTLHLLP